MSESTKKHKATAPKKLNFAVFICSTSRYREVQLGEKIADISGDVIVSILRKSGHKVILRKIIADDSYMIADAMNTVLGSEEVDAAIFSGGTGIASKDVTIETVMPYLDKALPGFGEIFRRLSYDKIGSAAVMSRAIAGVANGKVLFCIPGSPDAVQISVETLILPETSHIVRHIRE